MALIIEKVKKYICISRVYKLHSITVYIYIYLQKNTAVFCYSILSIQRVGHMKYSQNSARIPK